MGPLPRSPVVMLRISGHLLRVSGGMGDDSDRHGASLSLERCIRYVLGVEVLLHRRSRYVAKSRGTCSGMSYISSSSRVHSSSLYAFRSLNHSLSIVSGSKHSSGPILSMSRFTNVIEL